MPAWLQNHLPHDKRQFVKTIFLHIFLIGTFIAVSSWIRSRNNEPIETWGIGSITLIWFYIHFFILIPRFLVYKNWVRYGIFVMLSLGIYVTLFQYFHDLEHPEPAAHEIELSEQIPHDPGKPIAITRDLRNRPPHEFEWLEGVFPFLFTLFGSLALYFIRDWFRQEERQKEQEAARLNAELAFLRSQVSPHFLFNVLNQIVSFSRKQPELVEPTVLRLSDLIRYMLYESDQETVPLSKEIDYLKAYIDLQEARFRNKLVVETVFEGGISTWQIAPLLLIPFVENAFKHGIGAVKNPIIKLHLKATTSELHFSVENKVSQMKMTKDESSGIGLENVRRRLSLLYPQHHDLQIQQDAVTFRVILHLKR